MDFYITEISKYFCLAKNVLIVMVPILINKDVFKPSYNDVKSTVWNHNYVCTTLIVFFSIFQTLQRKMEDHTWDNFAGQYQKWYILILLTFHWPEFSYMTTSSFKGGLNVYPTLCPERITEKYIVEQGSLSHTRSFLLVSIL